MLKHLTHNADGAECSASATSVPEVVTKESSVGKIKYNEDKFNTERLIVTMKLTEW